MNRDKLIELANNAFYDPNTVPAFQNDYWTITTAELEAFANAIIEECAKRFSGEARVIGTDEVMQILRALKEE